MRSAFAPAFMPCGFSAPTLTCQTERYHIANWVHVSATDERKTSQQIQMRKRTRIHRTCRRYRNSLGEKKAIGLRATLCTYVPLVHFETHTLRRRRDAKTMRRSSSKALSADSLAYFRASLVRVGAHRRRMFAPCVYGVLNVLCKNALWKSTTRQTGRKPAGNLWKLTCQRSQIKYRALNARVSPTKYARAYFSLSLSLSFSLFLFSLSRATRKARWLGAAVVTAYRRQAIECVNHVHTKESVHYSERMNA